MQQVNFHNNKYTPAALPTLCAPREGLLRRFERLSQKGLIFVSAPAGSGKTVSAQLWLQTAGRNAVWIGLDDYDNAPSVFYRLFCTGILSLQPENSRITAILGEESFDVNPVEATIRLLQACWDDGQRYALVLDDFHTITNAEILKSLPFVLRRLPHSFVTIVLSRGTPPDSFTDFFDGGSAAQIDAKALAFSAKEIRQYFGAMGRSINEGEAEAALAITGGWAIGVNALGQSDEIENGGNAGQSLERYIKRQIWDKWSNARRDFLLRAAVIDEMPVPLCAAITGTKDAGQQLQALCAANAFVVPVEDSVFRYHHLFLDFIRALPAYAALDKTAIWQQAARYYMANGEHTAARHYAFLSGDTKILLDTQELLTKTDNLSMDGYIEDARGFLQQENLQALCEKCPPLYIECVWVAYMTGDARAFEAYEDKLRRHAPMIILKQPRFAEMVFMLMALDYRTPFAKQIAQAALMPPMKFKDESLRAATMSFQMPFLHRSCRDFYELTDIRLYEKLKKTYGKLLKNQYVLVMSDVGAGLALEQNRTADALAFAKAAASHLNDKTTKEIRFATYAHLAAVYLALDRRTEMETVLAEATAFVEEKAPVMRANLLAVKARVPLWNGDRKAAKDWLANYFVTESKSLYPHKLYQYFTTLRAQIVLGELSKAQDFAVRLRQLGLDYCRPLDAAEAGTLLAVAQWNADDKRKAQESIETVLAEMQPHGFIRIIADEGAAVLPILKKIQARIARADYTGALDRVYVNNVYLAAYTVAKQRNGITANLDAKPVKLSKQQTLILAYLAQGFKNADIMEKTGLTINTVKAHTRLAYEKLGVNNAADAVLKGRELGIIL